MGANKNSPDRGCFYVFVGSLENRCYLKFGARNDAGQVKKLQEFLNEELGLTIPVNGIFGPATFKAVKMLQAAHTEDILAPWSKVGPALTDPTGYVYKTTQYWINKHNK
jgi:hypothetical protein